METQMKDCTMVEPDLTLEDIANSMSNPIANLYNGRRYLLAYKIESVAQDLEPSDYIKILAMINANKIKKPSYDDCNITFIASINAACDYYEIPKMYTIPVETLEGTVIDDTELSKLHEKFKVKINEVVSEEINDNTKVINFENSKLVFREKNMEASDIASVNPRHIKLIEDINLILFKSLPKDKTISHTYKVLSTGMVELVLNRNDKFIAAFTIDPNIIHCNGYYMFANSVVGTILVPFEHTDILRKVLAGTPEGDYILNIDEVNLCSEKLFKNLNVYQYVDLSNNKEILKLSPDSYKKLGYILDLMIVSYHAYYGVIPRFRLTNFIDINNFKLVSDEKCKSPLHTMPSNYNDSTIELKSGKDFIITLSNGITSSCKVPGKEEEIPILEGVVE